MQLREPGLDARRLAELVRDCRQLASGTNCRVLVNDRLDVAVAARANGVHLREGSVTVEDARRLPLRGEPMEAVSTATKFIVGRSVHDAATAVTSQTADYLVVGSVFATDSKPGEHRTLGLEGLREIVTAAGTCPVWAVGGITRAHLRDVSATGVDGIAAIGAFLPTGSTDIEGNVRKLTEELRFSLDRRG